jgi:predicted anti-sigma-YlaC factor YlaD
MNCVKFQDSLSDYIEGALDPRARAECAAHRLICGACRELYNDVRATVQALNAVGDGALAEPDGLRHRILAATGAGEMLSCVEFDKLLERYFDGVILAPTFQTFQSHFEKCFKCSRLLNGIEEAIELCREVKESEVEVPNSLHDRIVAATVGRESEGFFERVKSVVINHARPFLSPQIAVAAMILAAISLLVISRFGSVSNLTISAEQKAESLVNQGQQKINSTGAMARSGFQRVSYEVNSLFFSGAPQPVPAKVSIPAPPRTQSSPQLRLQRDSDLAPGTTTPEQQRRTPNQRQQ